MTTQRHIPTFAYKLMLLAATMIWGVAFVIMKDAVDVLPPSQLIGVRFLLTGIIMTAILWRPVMHSMNKKFFIACLVLGASSYLAFWVQTIGLAATTPGKNAFLTATYCVIVPFMLWFSKGKRPRLSNIAAAIICVVGIGLVSVTSDSFSIGFGDLMTILCAFFFAIEIIAVAHYTQLFDVMALTAFQFIPAGIMGIVIGVVVEPLPDLSAITPDFIFNLLYLVLFASGICYVFQNVGLAHVPPAQGSLLLSLESVFGVLASVLLYHEVVTVRMLIGFGLIFIAILVSELTPLLIPQTTTKSPCRANERALPQQDDEPENCQTP